MALALLKKPRIVESLTPHHKPPRAVFLRLKIMIERIYGDTEPAHIVVAHKAMEAHKAKYGEGNKFHPRIYSVAYRGRFYQIEVVTRRKTMAATVITGVRTLTKVLEVA